MLELSKQKSSVYIKLSVHKLITCALHNNGLCSLINSYYFV